MEQSCTKQETIFRARRLQCIRLGQRDGRLLRKFLETDNPDGLQCFFSIMQKDPIDEDGIELPPPVLNLNEEVYPGWTLLEVLVDFDTQECSNLFFEIKDQLLTHETGNGEVTLKADKDDVRAQFISKEKVNERKHMARHCRWSKSIEYREKKLEKWGATYGRFFFFDRYCI